MVEAMEIVEMYCDTLLARFGMIEQLKTLDEGIEEAVSSLIWVAPRMQSDVKELKVVHDILMMKYGKPYATAVRENQLKTVNEKLMIKMGVQAPPKILVERYLIGEWVFRGMRNRVWRQRMGTFSIEKLWMVICLEGPCIDDKSVQSTKSLVSPITNIYFFPFAPQKSPKHSTSITSQTRTFFARTNSTAKVALAALAVATPASLTTPVCHLRRALALR